MEFISAVLDFILHIDVHLIEIVQTYQGWTYLILFLIIFAETGLVVTPFLPGDSVLFALGAIIAKPESGLSLLLFWLLLVFAAILGDFVNYEIGKYLGSKVFKPGSRIFKPSYLARTEHFYTAHGTKTIIYARFVPIVRTFAPFVAGVGKMPYRKFGTFNVIGALLWVSLFLFSGYCFGQIPFFRDHFSMVVLCIIVLSLIPVMLQFISSKSKKSA